MIWPALYGVLTPVCLEVSDGLRFCTAPRIFSSVAENDGQLEITLYGDRDLAGEIVFEGAKVDKIKSATMDGEPVRMVRDEKRIAFIYRHKHKEEMTLTSGYYHESHP